MTTEPSHGRTIEAGFFLSLILLPFQYTKKFYAEQVPFGECFGFGGPYILLLGLPEYLANLDPYTRFIFATLSSTVIDHLIFEPNRKMGETIMIFLPFAVAAFAYSLFRPEVIKALEENANSSMMGRNVQQIQN